MALHNLQLCRIKFLTAFEEYPIMQYLGSSLHEMPNCSHVLHMSDNVDCYFPIYEKYVILYGNGLLQSLI